MSRDSNRRGKKGGHHNSGRYGHNSPNFHHRNYMGAESPNWRDGSSTEGGQHPQQRPMLTPLQQSYGEFLMKGWKEFEEEKRSLAAAKGFEVKIIKEDKAETEPDGKAAINLEHLEKEVRRTAA